MLTTHLALERLGLDADHSFSPEVENKLYFCSHYVPACLSGVHINNLLKPIVIFTFMRYTRIAFAESVT
jgi:hypothetical protein